MNVNEFVQKYMCEHGIEQATGVSIKFDDGRVIHIHSDDHPALSQPAEGIQSVTPRQSAQGGN